MSCHVSCAESPWRNRCFSLPASCKWRSVTAETERRSNHWRCLSMRETVGFDSEIHTLVPQHNNCASVSRVSVHLSLLWGCIVHNKWCRITTARAIFYCPFTDCTGDMVDFATVGTIVRYVLFAASPPYDVITFAAMAFFYFDVVSYFHKNRSGEVPAKVYVLSPSFQR